MSGAPVDSFEFPAGFLWGASTASHQVEGNNRWNDWWDFESRGRLPFRSGDACRHYELYERDFDLVRELGQNAHRFSVEWSRVEPLEGQWSLDALDHYRDVIAALRARDVEPVITLHHFTNPKWFQDKGGWLRSEAPAEFGRFVETFTRHCGEGVKYWITVNEPTVYAKHGFVLGDWPPCVRGSWRGALRVLRNLAVAHTVAYHVLHSRPGEVRVGLAHSAPWIEPARPRSRADRCAAWLRDFVLNDAFFLLLRVVAWRRSGGRLPLDFIGLNYYTRSVVASQGSILRRAIGAECLAVDGRGPMSDTGWEIYPEGLLRVLLKFQRLGLPLVVTENGIATADEELRSRFLEDHLGYLARALAGGVEILGYFYWSLMDNYEWALGTEPRFGLAMTDFRTQNRIPTPCAGQYAEVCLANRIVTAVRREETVLQKNSTCNGERGSQGEGRHADS